jgi:ferredoxin
MATMITSECINCGACEPECPNTAIYQGGVEWQAADGTMHPALSNDIFYIVPEKCTECVGFHDAEACAAVCPVDCCVPNPDIPETHEVLLERARALHPGEAIPDDAPSRFRKEGGPSSPAPKPSGQAPATAVPAAVAARPAAAVPAPVAAPAAALSARLVVGVRGRVEKPTARPAATGRSARTFGGELPVEFEQLMTQLGAPRRRLASPLGRVALGVLAAGQGVLGALPAATKRRLEAAVGDRRFFDAQLATAANVFLNLLLYPIGLVAYAVGVAGVGLFTGGVHRWIFLGLAAATLEAAFRLRENFFRGVPLGETPLRGAVYGLLLWPVGRLVVLLAGARGAESGVGFDGFAGGREHFDEKVERERRYGSIYRLEERDDAYLLRVEFPRRIPPSSLADELKLPPEMPDYDYELALQDATFVVHGRVVDPQVRKLTAVAPAFPSEFTTRVTLRDRVTGFRHRYRDKVLEVILPKAAP